MCPGLVLPACLKSAYVLGAGRASNTHAHGTAYQEVRAREASASFRQRRTRLQCLALCCVCAGFKMNDVRLSPPSSSFAGRQAGVEIAQAAL